jgi:hypothetical protein
MAAMLQAQEAAREASDRFAPHTHEPITVDVLRVLRSLARSIQWGEQGGLAEMCETWIEVH